MDDLIINVNIDETNQHRSLILDTYLGKIRSLQNKQYSGQLRKVNVFSLLEENISISKEKLDTFKNIICENNSKQLANYKYLINGNTNQIFSALKSFTLYYSSYKSSMNRIFEFYNDPFKILIAKSKKNDDYNIQLIEQTKSITSYARLIKLHNGQIFLFDYNAIYLISDIKNITKWSLDINLINFFMKNSCKLTELQIKKYLTNQTTKNKIVTERDEKIKNVFNIIPKPIIYLYLDKFKKIITANLNFKYESTEFTSDSTDEYVIFNHQKIYRDKRMENEYINILIQYNWRKSLGQNFVYQGIDITKDIDSLQKKEFIILSEKKSKIFSASNYTYHMSYEIDWFSIDASIQVNGKEYSLAQLLKNNNKQQQWIEVDNNIFMLPKEFTEHKEIWTIKNKKVVIPKKNIGDALELAEQLAVKIQNIESITDFKSIQIEASDKLLKILREYQLEGVKWLLYLYINHFGGCLADDMGLGKTLQIIAFLSDQRLKCNNKPSLVIVPKTLIFNWSKELEKFNPELKPIIYHGSMRSLDFIQGNIPDIILTTYGTVLNDVDQLRKLTYNCIILDESQYIKNNKSKTYSAICQLSSQVKIALTGTPIENNIGELWSLMDLLNKNAWGKKKDFVNRYFSQMSLLNTKISPFLLRRTKKQVLKDLPEKTESIIYCTMEDSQRELYSAALINIKEEITKLPGRYEIKSNSFILEGLLRLRQICCHPKLLAAKYNINSCNTSAKFEVMQDIVDDLCSKNEKIVIFSQFTTMLKIIESWIKRKNYQCFYLDGQTCNRETVINNFEKSTQGILLISLKAGGVGINLVSASYAIIYDPWWNPAAENQAADRLYRIGQKRNVTIYKLITANTIEEKVNDLKKIKTDISDKVLEDQDVIKTLSMADLQNLLM